MSMFFIGKSVYNGVVCFSSLSSLVVLQCMHEHETFGCTYTSY